MGHMTMSAEPPCSQPCAIPPKPTRLCLSPGCSAAPTYTWTDQPGQTHPVQQAEGGEQGDPPMPALFSLASNTALQQFHQDLYDGERVAAYLDDIYITAQPSRIRTLFDALAKHLSTHAGIRLHAGKTEVWNAGGVGPPNVQEFTHHHYTGVVWEPNSPTHSARLGSSAFRSDTRNISRRSWPNSVENYQHSRTYRQAGYCCCTARRPASTMPYGASAQTSHEPLQQLPHMPGTVTPTTNG